ncbi:hypothetical protein Poli38472_000980 [Pythium oligandrum]|uniref:TLC domain-containing protein n=1 Tax=Pythium oligandrum TaxID=41045 RepID=A0A8K1CE77_PYTOL|nr:hypothetical protein Poli38472_000980 [Pythium oligandrum]|eukprot:TMW60938.1 hypothetical protein Poli38472_000980 [Pythium oligandrum]
MAVMTITLVPMFWCEVRGVTEMREHPALRNTPDMPQVADLWIAVVMALGIIAVRYVLVRALEPVSRAILPPHLRDSAFRIDRLATSLFNAFYFSWVSIVGYIILKNEEWFPASLGGSGDFDQAFKVFDIVPTSSAKLYVLLQLAYQIHNLIYVLLLKPLDNDVMDFVVHDFTAILLIGSSYLTNYYAIGATIGFLNDACDIAMFTFSVSTDSERKPVIAVMTLTILVVWGYTRLYVYPLEILSGVFTESPKDNPNLSPLFFWLMRIMLSFLLVLQTWWLVLFAEKGRRKLLRPTVTTQLKQIVRV